MSPTEWGFLLDADQSDAFYFAGILRGIRSNFSENFRYGNNGQRNNMPLALDTFFQSSYHSNERETRPKTKFFSLLIYAGYPMQ